ncbi:serine/threonine-protein kinase [Aporhodopirellula aestuarii]|uniref:Serine/threonine protein kinase n=1 Tax=Aporhodopirellula aestuarii TaxID=2950107 RepID=A0ABT0U6G1_9BACT|nr:serine/threonine-protein kinase [Aporhodopirellula aestuarii]MCM2372537.1 serine/threonine protein kinase [Aporhodopirellula aestuarii]
MTNRSASRDPVERIERINPIVDDVFDQADPTKAYGQALESDDDICPLFCAITRIKSRYQEPELIGRGGMKEVYRVYDAKAARHAALAKPLPEFSRDQFDAFLREAHLTARLDHPNIIDLFDMGVDDEGRPFFTMELKQGRSLRGVLNSIKNGEQLGEFPLQRRLEIFQRVCDAIAYAHSRRILHLDIKPENIFVGDYGEVKVCDWGMGVVMAQEQGEHNSAVLLDPDLYGSLLDSAKGTPVYMAPEQKNKRQTKTPQMDIYAMGCLLRELLTLELPADGSDTDSNLDAALAATIGKATARIPSDRYQNVEELRNDVSRFLGGYSSSVERLSLRREAALFYRRHREACAIAFGSLAIFGICVAYFVIQLRLSRQQAVEALERSERAQAVAEQSQAEAVTSLAQYLAEKEESEKRQYQQVLSAIDLSDFVTDSKFLRDEALPSAIAHSMKHLESILIFDPPPDSKAWLQKYYLYFLTQNFDLALELVDQGKFIEPDLVLLADKYLELQDAEGHLDTDEFIALLRELCSPGPGLSRLRRGQLAEKMLIFDSLQRNAIADKVRVVQAWIEINNHKWQNPEMVYEANTETIRLRGKGLTRLARIFSGGGPANQKLCLVYILKPRVLDLREIEISRLSDLTGLELQELDIRQTPVTNLLPLQNNRSLRRVYIDPDQVSEFQLANLPESIEIVQESE